MEGAAVTRSERLIWVDGVPHLEVTTSQPLRHAAALETLAIIRDNPGTSAYQIAKQRGTTPRAANQTVLYLERRHAIRTQLEPSKGNRFHRACYLTETE